MYNQLKGHWASFYSQTLICLSYLIANDVWVNACYSVDKKIII